MLRTNPKSRTGAVTVEFALTAPLLFLLCFAGIEFSRVNMLLHTAAIAATESARRGIVSGATADDCYAVAEAELAAVGVNDATVLVRPETINQDTEVVTVAVNVPLGIINGYVTPKFFLGDEVLRVVSVTREAKDGADSEAMTDAATDAAMQDVQNGGGRKVGKANKQKSKSKAKEDKAKDAKAKGKKTKGKKK